MDLSDDLQLLRTFVHAHDQLHPNTKGREPIMFSMHSGGASLHHHAFPQGEAPLADETTLEDLQAKGLLNIDYREHTWFLTPSIEGRALVAQLEQAGSTEPVGEIGPLLQAVKLQGTSDNKLAWPAVRPVLAALRRYWETADFPPEGVGMRPLIVAIPEGTEARFAATIRSLIGSDYLESASSIVMNDVPAYVRFTDRSLAVVDGWPGATGAELTENLIAVLTELAEREPDHEKRKRLERARDAVATLGTKVASEVLSKVLMGG